MKPNTKAIELNDFEILIQWVISTDAPELGIPPAERLQQLHDHISNPQPNHPPVDSRSDWRCKRIRQEIRQMHKETTL